MRRTEVVVRVFGVLLAILGAVLGVAGVLGLLARAKDPPPTVIDLDAVVAERQIRFTCLNNLSTLVLRYIELTVERSDRPRYDGAALLLSWRSQKLRILRGQEEVLRCPGDPHLAALDAAGVRDRYDAVDLNDIPDDLCSYAVRDFSNYPVDLNTQPPEAIMCCRQGRDGRTPHHTRGLCVGFSDGVTKFVTHEELGLAPGDPIVVGPESKSPLLKKLIYAKRR